MCTGLPSRGHLSRRTVLGAKCQELGRRHLSSCTQFVPLSLTSTVLQQCRQRLPACSVTCLETEAPSHWATWTGLCQAKLTAPSVLLFLLPLPLFPVP